MTASAPEATAEKQGQARPAMLIVCRARWADAKGEVGPWSRTLVTRIEGTAPIAGLDQPKVECDDERPVLKLAG